MQNLTAENFTGRQHEVGWDLAYFDPPYDSDYLIVMHDFGTNELLRGGGTLIVEHHAKKHMHEEIGRLRRWRVLKQGHTSLSFYEHA